MESTSWGNTPSCTMVASFNNKPYTQPNCVAIPKTEFATGTNIYTIETVVTDPNDSSYNNVDTETVTVE